MDEECSFLRHSKALTSEIFKNGNARRCAEHDGGGTIEATLFSVEEQDITINEI